MLKKVSRLGMINLLSEKLIQLCCCVIHTINNTTIDSHIPNHCTHNR